MTRQLLVFAHRDEASAFADVPHTVTGVGKVNAAASLARELFDAAAAQQPIDEVLVLGTAGIVSDEHDLNTVVQVRHAVQHDFSLDSPKLTFGAPTLESPVTIATGDQFVKDDTQRARIAKLGASLCDMEVYAYAAVCEKFGVDLRVFKVPSDFADSATTDEEWDDIVFLKSRQLREFYDSVLAAPRAAGVGV